MGIPIAVQLYTLRDETKKDFRSVLEKVARIGYAGVEFAGFGDVPARVMRRFLQDNGLKAVGNHTAKELIADRLDEAVEYNLEIGSRYIVCPWDKYDTYEEWIEAAKWYDETGAIIRGKGLKLCYHNHAHEFQAYNGRLAIEILAEDTGPDNLKFEPDTYWIRHAGLDPAEHIIKYGDRCPLIHIKDMGPDDKDTVEIGEGIMDIKAIIEASRMIGAEWLIVEQDNCKRPSLESVELSHMNLSNILYRR